MNISTNPYTQAGWPAIDNTSGSTPLPSIFGALPFSSLPSKPSIHKFHFAAFNPDILHCTVFGPRSKPYFQVLHNSAYENSTLIQRYDDGSIVATIEWRESLGTVVEVRDVISKQQASTWLRLSDDQRQTLVIFIF